MEKKPIGQLLIEKNYITEKQRNTALLEQSTLKKLGNNEKIGEILTRYGFTTTKELSNILANETTKYTIPHKIYELQKKYFFYISKEDDNTVEITVPKILNEQTIANITTFFKNKKIVQKLAGIGKIKNTLSKELTPDDLDKYKEPTEITHTLLKDALLQRASDIHIELYTNIGWIKYRIDGEIHPQYCYPKDIISLMTASIKSKANLDITQKFLPQDGSFTEIFDNIKVDFRVSCIPTINGESLEIRILNRKTGLLSLHEVFPPENYGKKIIDYIENLTHSNTNGLFIIAGQTGSGKTTTLNAIIQNIDRLSKTVITIEDPVEYTIEHTKQIQINELAGLKFSNILRNVIRHDPDIIVVGEIRDPETLEMCLAAANTGHLVFSTVHANNSMLALLRLVELGGDINLIAQTLKGVIHQKLIKKLCDCVKEGLTQCPYCINKYRGRVLAIEGILIKKNDPKTINTILEALQKNTNIEESENIEIINLQDVLKYLIDSKTTTKEEIKKAYAHL